MEIFTREIPIGAPPPKLCVLDKLRTSKTNTYFTVTTNKNYILKYTVLYDEVSHDIAVILTFSTIRNLIKCTIYYTMAFFVYSNVSFTMYMYTLFTSLHLGFSPEDCFYTQVMLLVFI